MATIACGALMATALVQAIGDVHHVNVDIPPEPARTAGFLLIGFLGCAILCLIVRRELRFRSPGALIEAPELEPVVWPRILRLLILTVFTLWLVTTQIPLDLPLLTAFWSAEGYALAIFSAIGCIRDSLLDRRRWVMNTMFGLVGIGEGLTVVILCRPWHADAGLLLPIFVFCAVVALLMFITGTVSMIRRRRNTTSERFSPMRAVDDASEGLTQLVVDHYDSGATLKTREQWTRWIRIGLVTVAVVMVGFFIISLYTR
ncbi:hypothetical protein [Kocuria massiliensis]|uniref:hypothetical protein n=1 Tax=Kocuria massiliensis TaxID=1926282 RepID=UPI00117B36DB|nr:hypothetical protein [Kocuria massiliensis]